MKVLSDSHKINCALKAVSLFVDKMAGYNKPLISVTIPKY